MHPLTVVDFLKSITLACHISLFFFTSLELFLCAILLRPDMNNFTHKHVVESESESCPIVTEYIKIAEQPISQTLQVFVSPKLAKLKHIELVID